MKGLQNYTNMNPGNRGITENDSEMEDRRKWIGCISAWKGEVVASCWLNWWNIGLAIAYCVCTVFLMEKM